MNRTGLYIALAIGLVTGVVFGLYPQLDVKVTTFFYDAQTKNFPISSITWAKVAREAAMWVTWAFVLPALGALVIKLVRPVKPLLMSGRTMAFLLVTIFLSAIVLTNIVFKGYWGRPRPVAVTQFNGPLEFKAWWDPSGKCPKNCSFFSGEGGTAFWTYAPAALAPPQWRPAAYIAATAFGLATGGLRITFGGHFATDVIASGVVSFIVAWLAYAFIFRWPSTRMTDWSIDAWLTRLAWPGYRWRQKLFGRDVGPVPTMRYVPHSARRHEPDRGSARSAL
ncbi:MAG: phosphatase PAP2 family protein [Xanthobacteraceae bacterium]|nr:phosphatase PAP2 family protein [Xanthobacteraceae bacterium]